MTLTIPIWLLYIVGGFAALVALAFMSLGAFIFLALVTGGNNRFGPW
jgi:hypothetical protein